MVKKTIYAVFAFWAACQAAARSHIANTRYRVFYIASLMVFSLACGLLSPSPATPAALMATRTAMPTFTQIVGLQSIQAAPTFTSTPRPTFTPIGNSAPAEQPGAPAEANPNPAAATPTPAPAGDQPANNAQPTNTPAADNSVPPTATNTAAPNAAPTNTPPPNVAPTPTSAANPAPTATGVPPANNPNPSLPGAQVTPSTENDGWAFASITIYNDQYEDGLLIYGDMINNTGSPQELDFVTGEFYDGSGALIAGEESTLDAWPIFIIPAGGRVPFEMTVDDIDSTANFELFIESESTSDQIEQGFDFPKQGGGYDGDEYCVQGLLHNPGFAIDTELVIAAILFDAENKIINYGEYFSFPEDIGDNNELEFEICVEPPNANIDRVELRAWGD